MGSVANNIEHGNVVREGGVKEEERSRKKWLTNITEWTMAEAGQRLTRDKIKYYARFSNNGARKNLLQVMV